MDKYQFLQQLSQLYQAQNWLALESFCTKGLEYFPGSDNIYYHRAISRANLGHFHEAKQDLEKTLKINSNHPNARPFLEQIKRKVKDIPKTFIPSPSQVFRKNEDALEQLFVGTSASEKKQFGRYQIIEELGRGGMGKVYKAYDSELKRKLALKTILQSGREIMIKRFIKEAEATAKLSHPNIVKIYDFGKEGDVYFFTMDFINGKNLSQAQNMTIRKVVEIMRKVSEAIDYAHQQGIIHRDLKPANIMISEEGNPYIMDFGLARETKSETKLSKSGDTIGTPAYMPPEQAQGKIKEIDERSDVYSLGVILYELLTGHPPFRGNTTHAILIQVIEQEPVPPRQISSRVPRDLETICLKAMEKNKNHRYQSACEMGEDFRKFLSGEPIASSWYQFHWYYKKTIKHWKKFTLVVAILLVSLLAYQIPIYQQRLEQEQKQKIKKQAQILLQKIANKLKNKEIDIALQMHSKFKKNYSKLAKKYDLENFSTIKIWKWEKGQLLKLIEKELRASKLFYTGYGRIGFGDVNNDGKMEIVGGWGHPKKKG